MKWKHHKIVINPFFDAGRDESTTNNMLFLWENNVNTGVKGLSKMYGRKLSRHKSQRCSKQDQTNTMVLNLSEGRNRRFSQLPS